jgi:tripartite-type tricarboxylate transporter receptor subunit TctC
METIHAYPNKPIRLLAPFPPGGPGDIVAREIGQRMSEAWGQQVVVDNRAGAGGMIATDLVAKAAPDGYTLLIGSSGGLVLQPLLSSKMPYDALKDFAPISKAIIGSHVLVLNPQVPAGTVKELISLAKAKPGQLNFASAGLGSATQLSGELFKAMAGIDIVHVPYKGGVAALTDMVAGQVHLMFNSIPPVLPFGKTGRLKIVAVSSLKRLAILPEVPAVAETLPGFQSGVWYGIFAPAGTPRPVINKLSAEILKTLAMTEIAQRLTAQGVEPRGSTPQELAQFMAQDRARWKKVITSAHLAE